MNDLKEKINFRIWIITFVIFLVTVAGSVGYAMGHVKSEVGMQVFDLEFTYDYDYAQEFMSLASDEIIDFYRHVQIPIDYTLAIMLGGFAFVSFLYISKRIKVNNVFLYIALAVSALDIIENTLLFIILGDSSLNATLVSTAGTVTLIKNLCMYTTYLVLIYYTIKYNKKKKE